MTKTKFYLIWKDSLAYYLFDPHGRDFTGSVNLKNGSVSLFCFEKIQNLTHFIADRSKFKSTTCYSLFNIEVIRLNEILSSDEKLHEITTQARQITKWRIVNSAMAILRGTFHIGNTCFGNFENISERSFAANLLAITYTKLNPPNSWNSKVIDKILLLGYKFSIENKNFNINSLPLSFKLGEYNFTLKINSNIFIGNLWYAVHFKQTELRQCLHQFFNEYDAVLIQTDNKFTFVAWKRDNTFYLFDSYGRPANGLIPDHGSKPTSATLDLRSCLHMHNTLDSLCSILFDNVMKISPKKSFALHQVIVKNCDNSLSNMSLNESINSLFLPKLTCIPEVDIMTDYSGTSIMESENDFSDDDTIELSYEETAEEILIPDLDLSPTESEGNNRELLRFCFLRYQ